MQELLSFLGSYIGEEDFNNSLWVILLLLYAAATFYMIDFYNLVKRKSRAETMGMMAIPFAVSMIGAVLAAMFVRVPAPEYAGCFPVYRSTVLLLCSCFVLYGVWQAEKVRFGAGRMGIVVLSVCGLFSVLQNYSSGRRVFCPALFRKDSNFQMERRKEAFRFFVSILCAVSKCYFPESLSLMRKLALILTFLMFMVLYTLRSS